MDSVWTRIKNEPAVVSAIVRQAIVLLSAFGLNMTAEQTVAVSLFVESITTLFTRQSVTPNQLAEHRVAMGGSPTVPLDEKKG
jgi:hypothetical protein